MWQINAADRTNDQKVYLRPHAWVNGAATVLQDIDISNVILWDARNDFHHLKIDIVGNKQIRTSIDGILVDTREWDVSFDKTGFREDGAESACFDNLVICENNDEVCSEKFDSSNNPFKKEPVECLGRKVLSFAGEGAVITDLREGTGEPMFRKEFSVTKTVSQARLYATALGVYEAYINGQKVGNDKLDPGWTNYKKTLLYQTFDITDMLKQGDNAVGAVVGSGWYAGKTGNDFLACYGVDKAFLGQIVITYTDGTRDVIGTDNTWKCQETGPYVATDLEDGETYDATRESDGWNEAGFNADGWIGTKIADENTINTKIKISALDIKARNGEAVQQIQELVPVKTKASTENSVIYNLGQNISGVVRLKAAGKAGQTVRIRYGEMLNSDGSLYTENLRNAKATDYYTFKGGNAEEVFEPSFTTHGFQYIEISWDSEAPAISSVTGIALSDNLEKTGNVETSNSELNQLFSNINWSQRDNYLSIPTDCPQRDERLGWTGDAHIFARTGSLNYNSKQFMERYLEILRTDQKSDGMVYDINPYQGSVSSGNAGWADAAVIIPWTLYTQYNDTEAITDNYDMMKGWLGYYQANSVGYIAPSCDYGDWMSPSETTSGSLIATAYFAYDADLFSKMAAAIGKTDDAAYYQSLFKSVKEAFVREYVNTSDGTVGNGSQTSYTLALWFNLLPSDDLREKAAIKLVTKIQEADWHLGTGFIGTAYLCPVLSEMGYSEVAYKILETDTYPSWLYSVKNGATTTWERWDGYNAETGKFGFSGMNSLNHYAYGAVGEWMYRYQAGIQNDGAGYKNIIIKPQVNDSLTHVKGSYVSDYGEIISEWSLNGSACVFNVKIPANTTATVYIPATTAEDLKIDGNAYIPGTTDAEGVSYSGSENQCLIFKIKSGSYTFETENISVESKSDTIYNGVDYSSVYNYDYYVTKYPDVKELCGEDKTKALEHFVNNGMKEGRQAINSFNVDSYAMEYSDVRQYCGNVMTEYYKHYMNHGIYENRHGTGCASIQGGVAVYNGINYSAVYDYGYYAANNAKVWSAYKYDEIAALRHFVLYGRFEGLQAIASFNVDSYAKEYADLRRAFKNNLFDYYNHFIEYGVKEGRHGTGRDTFRGAETARDGVDYGAVYDRDYYVKNNSDVYREYKYDDSGTLDHFITYGMSEGRRAKESFDVNSYAREYSDLRHEYGNDLTGYYLHYIRYGRKEHRHTTGCTEILGGLTSSEGKDYSAVYNYGYYVSRYADLWAVFHYDEQGALNHFLTYGMREGRQASPDFNVILYRKRYGDLQNAFGGDLKSYYLHYVNYGKRENRNAV